MKKIFNFVYSRRVFINFSLLRFMATFLGLISNIVIVRKLSIDNYGVFSVATMVIGLATTFGFSWSSSSILFYGSKEKEVYGNLNKTFWARNIIIFSSMLIVSVLFFIFRDVVNAYIGIEASLLILFWLIVSVAEDYLNQYFLATDKQVLSSVLSITAKTIYILAILIFSFNVRQLILLNILSHASVFIYIFAIDKRDIGKFEFDKEWFKDILNFSLWQLFGYSGLYLINFGDIFVIKLFMSNTEVGIYNVAYKLFNSIANFSFVISSFYAASVTKSFSSNNKTNIKSFFYKERLYIMIAILIIHVLVIAFSNQIIILLYGERYLVAANIFKILMVGSLFRFAGVFYMLYYNSVKKHNIQQLINIVRAILNILLNFILVKQFGLIGAAIATTSVIILSFIFSFIYCEKEIKKIIEEE